MISNNEDIKTEGSQAQMHPCTQTNLHMAEQLLQPYYSQLSHIFCSIHTHTHTPPSLKIITINKIKTKIIKAGRNIPAT